MHLETQPRVCRDAMRPSYTKAFLALGISVGINAMLLAVSFLLSLSREDVPIVSKAVEMLGWPGGIIAELVVGQGHEWTQVVASIFGSVGFYWLVAWLGVTFLSGSFSK